LSLRDYELVTLFPPTEEEDANASAVEKVTALVTGSGGKVTAVHEWGRRKLAYKIDDLAEAVYVLCKVQMEPDKTSDLDAAMRLDRELIRHLLVHDEGGEGPVAQPVAQESQDDG
jgi:small subunit ribosomal protein S6